jgi:hypothetical protein
MGVRAQAVRLFLAHARRCLNAPMTLVRLYRRNDATGEYRLLALG